MAGPVGWGIAGVALVGSGILFLRHREEKRRLDHIFTLIGERDIRLYKLAGVELNERISRIRSEEQLLRNANRDVQTFGTDYEAMTELQQYALGAYVNLMNSSTQLLVNPILGLQPKFSEEDLERFVSQIYNKKRVAHYRKCRKLIVALANLLYEIYLREEARKILWKALRDNDKMLRAAGIEKDEFDFGIVNAAVAALRHKYKRKY